MLFWNKNANLNPSLRPYSAVFAATHTEEEAPLLADEHRKEALLQPQWKPHESGVPILVVSVV
jgi:hypothetical protein